MSSKNLQGRIALVTGATRQVGRGMAVGLAEAGALVYFTGRRANPGKKTAAGNPYWGSLNNTLREIRAAGGEGVAVRSGRVLGTRFLGRAYGIVDTDGKQPPVPDDLDTWIDRYPEWRDASSAD